MKKLTVLTFEKHNEVGEPVEISNIDPNLQETTLHMTSLDKITSVDNLQENVNEDIAHALILDRSIQEQMKSNMLHSKQNESNRQ